MGARSKGNPPRKRGPKPDTLVLPGKWGEERREGPQRSHRPRPAGPSHRIRRAGAAGSPAFVLTSCLALCVKYLLLVFSLLVNPLRSTRSSHRPAPWPSSILPDGALAPPGRLWLRPFRQSYSLIPSARNNPCRRTCSGPAAAGSAGRRASQAHLHDRKYLSALLWPLPMPSTILSQLPIPTSNATGPEWQRCLTTCGRRSPTATESNATLVAAAWRLSTLPTT